MATSNAASATGGPVLQPSLQAQAISADEIALYDRQIRLWGVRAQEKYAVALE
ncbi:MAG: hypothetical protein LQ338_001376 [Usnochroma carphineum]|nr:MAG: hypothetical protein LQ338_001376 [Usnochroma carphineum]